MQTECHKCGAPTTQGEPFCGRCGAVVGMRDSARRPEDASPSFAPTVVGKPPKAAAAKRPPRPPQTRTKTPTKAGADKRDGGGGRYFVAGFAAVLLALMLLWLWASAGG